MLFPSLFSLVEREGGNREFCAAQLTAGVGPGPLFPLPVESGPLRPCRPFLLLLRIMSTQRNVEWVKTLEVMDVQVSRGVDTSRMAFETVFTELELDPTDAVSAREI